MARRFGWTAIPEPPFFVVRYRLVAHPLFAAHHAWLEGIGGAREAS